MDLPRNPIQVANKKIGTNEPVFIIAEIGINHDGKLSQAKELIEVAAEAGCDSAKFQLFTARDMYVHREAAGTYELMGKKLPIYDLVASMELPHEWLPELQDHCKSHGVLFFSSVLDSHSLRVVDGLGMEFFKFSSYDCTNIPLLSEAAGTGKPLVVSLGGATMREAAEAAEAMAGVQFAFMHCIAKYPAPFGSANLAVMDTLKHAFGCPVGFSDNGFVDAGGKIDDGVIPEAAAAAGADLFEIHITPDRGMPGPDHAFATEPDELKRIVRRMHGKREEYVAGRAPKVSPVLLGTPVRTTYDIERYVRDFCYRRIFAARDIGKGERFTQDNMAVLRPGASRDLGLEPRYYKILLDAHATSAIKRGSPIKWEHVLS